MPPAEQSSLSSNLQSSVPMSRRCRTSVLFWSLTVSQDGLCFAVEYEVRRLLRLASRFWQPARFLIASKTTVKRDPLEDQRCFVVKQGQLLSDVAEDLLPSHWLATVQDGTAASQDHSRSYLNTYGRKFTHIPSATTTTTAVTSTDCIHSIHTNPDLDEHAENSQPIALVHCVLETVVVRAVPVNQMKLENVQVGKG